MKKRRILITVLVILLMILVSLGAYVFFFMEPKENLSTMYLSSDTNVQYVLDEELNEVSFVRGTEVSLSDRIKKIDDKEYYKLYINDNVYYLESTDRLVSDIDDVVTLDSLYVYRDNTSYLSGDGSKISSFVRRGETVNISGYYGLNGDGSVDRYKTDKGYIYPKYLCESDDIPSEEYASYHRGIYSYDDGDGASGMDYYPNEKPSFEDNIMPDEVKAIYINDKAIYELDDYIDLAKYLGANTLVIDIRDSHIITVKLDAMKEYSPSSYEAGMFEKTEFKQMIQKAKDAGLYLVARITAFKDNNYALDHPEECIIDLSENAPLVYGEANWPTAYSRNMWEYNVELSKECISDLGFNEIQYDYVRFPEQVDYYADDLKILDLKNEYGESRSEAIEHFLMYAADEIHSVHGYLSACVFGETSNSYVAAYGQYWPAISNVVDVISPMPYPDHFNTHDFGISDAIVWEVPYRLMYAWGSQAKLRQAEIPTPARVRTWLQGYRAIREPKIYYDVNKVIEQIDGLKDAGLYDGFMVWNVLSDYELLRSYKEAFE